jgi:hypothetical protein
MATIDESEIVPLPERADLPPLTLMQIASLMHAGQGTIGPVAFYPPGCLVCERAQMLFADLVESARPAPEQEKLVATLRTPLPIGALTDLVTDLTELYGDGLVLLPFSPGEFARVVRP